MTLSEQAWNKASRIIAAIKQHPFNQELMKGTLALDKFAYYIEQDAIYLQDFARCQALIAAKVPLKYVRSFLRYADYTFIAEQEIVHQFFREIFSFSGNGTAYPCHTELYQLAACSLLAGAGRSRRGCNSALLLGIS